MRRTASLRAVGLWFWAVLVTAWHEQWRPTDADEPARAISGSSLLARGAILTALGLFGVPIMLFDRSVEAAENRVGGAIFYLMVALVGGWAARLGYKRQRRLGR